MFHINITPLTEALQKCPLAVSTSLLFSVSLQYFWLLVHDFCIILSRALNSNRQMPRKNSKNYKKYCPNNMNSYQHVSHLINRWLILTGIFKYWKMLSICIEKVWFFIQSQKRQREKKYNGLMNNMRRWIICIMLWEHNDMPLSSSPIILPKFQ